MSITAFQLAGNLQLQSCNWRKYKNYMRFRKLLGEVPVKFLNESPKKLLSLNPHKSEISVIDLSVFNR